MEDKGEDGQGGAGQEGVEISHDTSQGAIKAAGGQRIIGEDEIGIRHDTPEGVNKAAEARYDFRRKYNEEHPRSAARHIEKHLHEKAEKERKTEPEPDEVSETTLLGLPLLRKLTFRRKK